MSNLREQGFKLVRDISPGALYQERWQSFPTFSQGISFSSGCHRLTASSRYLGVLKSLGTVLQAKHNWAETFDTLIELQQPDKLPGQELSGGENRHEINSKSTEGGFLPWWERKHSFQMLSLWIRNWTTLGGAPRPWWATSLWLRVTVEDGGHLLIDAASREGLTLPRPFARH